MTSILEALNGIAAMGVGIGLMTVVGQCIGAKRKDEAIYYIKRLSWLSEIVILISCAVVYLLAKPVTISAAWKQKAPASACRWSHLLPYQTDFVGAFLLFPATAIAHRPM